MSLDKLLYINNRTFWLLLNRIVNFNHHQNEQDEYSVIFIIFYPKVLSKLLLFLSLPFPILIKFIAISNQGIFKEFQCNESKFIYVNKLNIFILL